MSSISYSKFLQKDGPGHKIQDFKEFYKYGEEGKLDISQSSICATPRNNDFNLNGFDGESLVGFNQEAWLDTQSL